MANNRSLYLSSPSAISHPTTCSPGLLDVVHRELGRPRVGPPPPAVGDCDWPGGVRTRSSALEFTPARLVWVHPGVVHSPRTTVSSLSHSHTFQWSDLAERALIQQKQQQKGMAKRQQHLNSHLWENMDTVVVMVCFCSHGIVFCRMACNVIQICSIRW